MITVKQYAEDRNITIQAVHQSMKGKRKKGLLEGHVHMVDGIKWLDDEAVQILDKDRRKPPVIFEREDANATIEQLRQDREVLMAKVTALSEWKAANAMAIAEAEQTKLMLAASEQEKVDLKAEIASLSDEKARVEGIAQEATKNAQRAVQEAQEAAERLQEAHRRERILMEYAEACREYGALSGLKRLFAKPPAPPVLED